MNTSQHARAAIVAHAGCYAARIDIFRAGFLRCTELRDLFVRVSECAGDRWLKDMTLNPDICSGAVCRTLAQLTTQ